MSSNWSLINDGCFLLLFLGLKGFLGLENFSIKPVLAPAEQGWLASLSRCENVEMTHHVVRWGEITCEQSWGSRKGTSPWKPGSLHLGGTICPGSCRFNRHLPGKKPEPEVLKRKGERAIHSLAWHIRRTMEQYSTACALLQ